MAKTLLDGVNEVLKRVKIIHGDNEALTTLADSARQGYIDVAIQAWNEAIDDLYSYSHKSKPLQMAESSITLATGDRDYALQTDLVRLQWPLHEQTTGYYIWEWQKGFEDLEQLQLQPSEWEGRPLYAAIRPSDGELYMDRIPTSEENGEVYTYNYQKELTLDEATDTVPFGDTVFRAMVPAVAHIWNRAMNREFDGAMLTASYGRAARYLSQTPPRDRWLAL